MPFTGACRRTNSQGRLRALRATASVEFGGFRAFRAGVKVASLRLQRARTRGGNTGGGGGYQIKRSARTIQARKAPADSHANCVAPWCVGSPHDPAIAMTRERLGGGAVAMRRPAHHAVDRVNARRRNTLPERRAAGMAERGQVQQQGEFAAGLAHEGERLQRESVGQAENHRAGW